MGSVEALMAEAREAGLKVSVEGNRLKVKGPQSTGPLVEKLRAHKREILQYLQTQAIVSMSIEDFQYGFYAVKVWSETLKRELWFVSNERAAHERRVRGLYFTGQELANLLRLEPSHRDLQSIVHTKEILRGRLVEK